MTSTNPSSASPLPEGRADGAALIAAERRRQIEAEGYQPAHDVEHADEALARAAAWYALPLENRVWASVDQPNLWPAGWRATPDKTGTTEGRIRELVKAGALIAAEIDRLAAPVVAVPEAGERGKKP